MYSFKELIEYLNTISSEDVVEMYTKLVRTDFYDPRETPEEVVSMRNIGFTTEFLKEFIISKMSN